MDKNEPTTIRGLEKTITDAIISALNDDRAGLAAVIAQTAIAKSLPVIAKNTTGISASLTVLSHMGGHRG